MDGCRGTDTAGAATGVGIRVGAGVDGLMVGSGAAATAAIGATAATGGAGVGKVTVFDEQRQLLESMVLFELVAGCK